MTDHKFDDLYGEAMRSISSSFSADFSLIDLLHHVVEECRDVLGIDDVGIVLADPDGRLHVLAATSERTTLVEAMQVDSGTGPCMESYRTGQSVTIQDFYGRSDEFSTLAREQGFKSVYATPLRRHIYAMGAINLFAAQAHASTEDRRTIADAFARITAVAVLVDRRSQGPTDRLEEALRARADIDSAKRIVMRQIRSDEIGALQTIRTYADQNMLSLVSVAREVISNGLVLEERLPDVSPLI